jgi:Na+/alanine symporter
MAEVLGGELKRIVTWEERHRRLVSRLVLVLALTAVIDVIGTILVYAFERKTAQTDIHSFFDAFFFTTVQLLTVSSQIKNPLSTAGRLVDIFLEIWAVVVVAGSAGAIASFFQSGDSA